MLLLMHEAFLFPICKLLSIGACRRGEVIGRFHVFHNNLEGFTLAEIKSYDKWAILLPEFWRDSHSYNEFVAINRL